MDKVGQITLERMRKVEGYNKWLLSLFRKNLRGDILEIGCGTGTFTKKFLEFGNVWAVDINKLYLKSVKKHIHKAKSGFGDIEKGKYFFGNKKFDSVVNLNVIEHIENDEKAMKNMYKLLKPGGKLIMLTPAHMFAYTKIDKNLGHFRRYTKREITLKLEKSGFKIIKVRYLNMIGLIGWFASGKVLRRNIIPSSHLSIFNIVSFPVLFIEKYFDSPFGLSVLVIAEKK